MQLLYKASQHPLPVYPGLAAFSTRTLRIHPEGRCAHAPRCACSCTRLQHVFILTSGARTLCIVPKGRCVLALARDRQQPVFNLTPGARTPRVNPKGRCVLALARACLQHVFSRITGARTLHIDPKGRCVLALARARLQQASSLTTGARTLRINPEGRCARALLRACSCTCSLAARVQPIHSPAGAALLRATSLPRRTRRARLGARDTVAIAPQCVSVTPL